MNEIVNKFLLAEHSQKRAPVLFQKDVALYFELYWKQENAPDIIFLVLH